MSRPRLAQLLVAVVTLLACASAGATTWTPLPRLPIDPGARLTAVSCPTTSLCVTTDDHGNVNISKSPFRRAPSWSRLRADPAAGLTGLACPSTRLCVAVDGAGNALASTDPAAPGSHWTEAAIDPGTGLTSISCPSVALCAVTDANQTVFTSTTPAGGATAWAPTVVHTGDVVSCDKYQGFPCASGLVGISCPSAGLCVANDTVGDVLTATNPTGGTNAWKTTDVDDADSYGGGMLGISCPSTRMCIAASNVPYAGTVDASADPAGDGSAWTSYPVGFDANWASCPLTSLCVTDQNTLSTDPLSGRAAWRRVKLDRRSLLTGASCPSRTECLAVDDGGHVVPLILARPPRRTGSSPRITGSARIGDTLRASSGGWSGSRPIRYAYRWERCHRRCVPITHANSKTLRVTPADRFWRIRVQVTASNVAGHRGPVNSAQTGPVGA